MADAHIWRHNLKIPKGVLAPTEKLVTLHIALKLHLGIKREGHVTAEFVDLHGVIDHEFSGKQGIDLLGIAAHLRDGVTHGRKIGNSRNSREILQQHPRRHEGDLRTAVGQRLPFRERLDIFGVNESAVLLAEQVLE